MGNKNWKEIISGIFITAFIIFFTYLIIGGQYYKGEIDRRGYYTIGKIVKKYYTSRAQSKVSYIYYVDGKEYKGSAHYNQNFNISDTFFLVKFLPEDPNKAHFRYQLPIKKVDNIMSLPPLEGWPEQPYKLVKKK